MELAVKFADMDAEAIVCVEEDDTMETFKTRVCREFGVSADHVALCDEMNTTWEGGTRLGDTSLDSTTVLTLRFAVEDVIAELRSGTMMFIECPMWARSNPAVQRAAVQVSASNLVFSDLKGDRNFLIECMETDPDNTASLLFFACKTLRKDRQLVLSAVHADGASLGFADESLLADPAFCVEALSIDARLFLDLPRSMQTRHILHSALKKNPACILFAPPALQADPELLFEVISKDASYLHTLKSPLMYDKAFVDRAIAANPDVAHYKPLPIRRLVAYV